MPAATEKERWFYKGPDGKCGPVSRGELLKRLVERSIPPESPVWRYGMETWVPAAGVAELRVAGFANPVSTSGTRAHGAHRFVLLFVALALAACVVWTVMARPGPQPVRQPGSLQERLVAIGRSADLEAMPVVIGAIADPDASVASTAVMVAEGLLGVRYLDAERRNPMALAEKIAADWKLTMEHVRRRSAGKDIKNQ